MFRPPTPGPEDFDSDEVASTFSYQFFIPGIDRCENIEKYVPGGLHPVLLGETYDNSRYKIIHKLGHGGFSTVWLATDMQENRYVALKFIMAEDSESYPDTESIETVLLKSEGEGSVSRLIVKSFRQFRFNGPNGRHLYLTGRNVLAQLLCLDDLSEDELFAKLGTPNTAPIKRYSNVPPGPSAPEYIVQATDLTRLGSRIRAQICIIDFDMSFPSHKPPAEMLGTPKWYLAPEAMFESQPGPKSDIWTLACTMFQMRSGFELFYDGISASPAAALNIINQTLGPWPKKWASIKFDFDGWPVSNDEPKAELLYTCEQPILPLKDLIRRICDQSQDERAEDGYGLIFWKAPPLEEGGYSWDYIHKQGLQHNFSPINEAEATCFHDLLSKMFAYDPEERISVNEVLKHPWFQYSDS